MMQAHDTEVRKIAQRVKTFHDTKRPFRIFHGSTNSTRQSPYTPEIVVDIRNLDNILHVDPEKKTALVEPNVPMDRLVEATLAMGLIPPVVHDFPGVTAGGGFSGSSGHSTAFRYGYFEDTTLSIEIVLGNGDIVRASRDGVNRDLFFGATSGFGTLGVVTMLEIRLILAPTHVALTYHVVNSFKAAADMLRDLSSEVSVTSLDAIMFSRTSGVVMVGRDLIQEDATLPTQTFSAPSDPWFYLHAQKHLKKPGSQLRTEAIPIIDFFFRYNRGSYWMGRGIFKYFLMPFNKLTRRIFDSLMDARAGYHRFHISGFTDHTIIQDLAVPYEAVNEFSAFLEDEVRWYPLWFAPLLIKHNRDEVARAPLASSEKTGTESHLFLNIGVWGPGYRNIADTTELNRDLEAKTHALGGLKLPYGYIYCDEEEFWSVYYDREKYEILREKYHGQYLPNVYDKVKYKPQRRNRTLKGRVKRVVWGIWPLGGLYAVLHEIFCEDYLMKHKSTQAG